MKAGSVLGIFAALVFFLALIAVLSPGKAQIYSPVTGTIVVKDYEGSRGVSAIPFSLPGSDCLVNLVVCDYGGVIPKTVGQRIVKNLEANWIEEQDSKGITGSTLPPGACTYVVNTQGEYSGVYVCKHPSTDVCFNQTSEYNGVFWEDTGYCCHRAGPDNVLGTADDYHVVPAINSAYTSMCCPINTTVYDGSLGKCVNAEVREAGKFEPMGTCGVSTFRLNYSTGVLTFFDAGGNPTITADYIAYSYIC
ncbi:MAG: hypothetical protein GXO63_00770 [Candidatus Micrarchaeota archaeon]|nr:hypothetical protein [Candidatus Micrarchaeota archaeon]